MPIRVQSLRSSTKNTRPAAGSREPGEIYTNFPDLQLGVIDASKNPKDLIAVRFFSVTTNYAVGDFVINAGVGYRAKEVIVAGAFNAAQWDTINVSGSAEPPIAAGTTSQYWRGDKNWATLDKAAVGLGAVDNTSDANKPISSAEQAALNLKANIASPTFTGDPKAPTPSVGDADTSIATTAFVAASFAPLTSPNFGGDPRAPTPATADNDTSIATTAYVKANLVTYAPLASPAFTGTPTAPTPSPGDSDTSLATTAFVQQEIGNRPLDAPNDTNAYGRKALGWVDVTEEAPADGVSYGRKNGTWVASVGGAVISDTPPPGPLTPGQLWWESDSGNTYLWFDDGSSQQWIQQNIQPATVANPLAGLTAQTRNRIVNGAMQISQENGDAPGSAIPAYYAADQWFASASIATSARRVANPTLNGTYPITMQVTTGKPSLAAADYLQFVQYIEGIHIRDFMWGTASAKQAVLRFWAYGTPGGTFSVFLRNSASNRSFMAPFTLPNSVWTQFTIVIPGDTTGTWLIDTGIGICLGFGFAAGATYAGGVAGWQSATHIQIAGQTNGAAATNNIFYIADVGLYLDPLNTGVAPAWEMPDEAEELRACQRYWEHLTGGFRWDHALTVGASTGFTHKFAATKRIAPAAATSLDALSGWTLQGYEQIQPSQLVINVAPIAAGPVARVGNINVKVNARM